MVGTGLRLEVKPEKVEDEDSEGEGKRDSGPVDDDIIEQDVILDQAFERPWREFWVPFMREAESRLKAAHVEPARKGGRCADGDLSLDGFEFASLRNEAFVCVACEGRRGQDHRGAAGRSHDEEEEEEEEAEQKHRHHECDFVYPPNHCGWNAAGHETIVVPE